MRGVHRRHDEARGDEHERDGGDAEEARQVQAHAAAIDAPAESGREQDPEQRADPGGVRVARRLERCEQEDRRSRDPRAGRRRTPSRRAPRSSPPPARWRRVARRSPARSRACRRIQTIMNVTMPTAISATTVSRPSCSALRELLVQRSGARSPRRGRSRPRPRRRAHIQRSASRRPSCIRNAAMMPTISDASSPSRSPITKVGSTQSLAAARITPGDYHAHVRQPLHNP